MSKADFWVVMVTDDEGKERAIYGSESRARCLSFIDVRFENDANRSRVRIRGLKFVDENEGADEH